MSEHLRDPVVPPDGCAQNTASLRERPGIFARAVIAGAAIGSVLIPAASTEGATYRPEKIVPALSTGDTLPKPIALSSIQHRSQAPNLATPGRLQALEALLDEPEDPDVSATAKQYYTQLTQGFRKNESLTNYEYSVQAFIGRKVLARRYGVKIYNPADYIAPLNDTLSDGSIYTRPFSLYFSHAQAYLAKFGVKLRVAQEPIHASNEQFNPPKTGELETTTAKMNMIALINSFSQYTQEYVDLAEGGNKRTMTIDLGVNPKSHYNGTTDTPSTSIGLNMSYEETSAYGSVTDHEVYHNINWTMFGNAWGNDPTFTSLNGERQYGQKGNDSRSLQLFREATVKKWQTYVSLSMRGQFKAACASQKALNDYVAQQGPNILYATPYGGAKDVLEDRAEIGEAIPGNQYTDMLSPDIPVIRKKLLHEMAELFAVAPRTLAYMVAQDHDRFSTPWRYTDASDCTKKMIAKGG